MYGFVRPTEDDLLPDHADRELFEETSAALEAGSLIRCFRTKADLTQAGLAERLHVSQARISQLENAEGRDGPTYGLLRPLAAVCNINLTELLITAILRQE